jgi:tetratricopeptide (TPR) repeat protein
VAKSKTNDPVALTQIGMIHETLQQYPAARDAYEKALKGNPQFYPALNNLAALYSERLGQVEQAHSLAERARQLWPYDPVIADTLGWILYRQGKYTGALGLIQESALRLPNEPEVQFHLGMTHYMLGEEDPARVALEQAVKTDKDFPEKAEGRRRLALLAIDVNNASPAALADLEKRLRESPNDPIALARLAALEEREGRLGKAVDTYEEALRLNPQDTLAVLKLAQLYSDRLNDPVKAMRLASQAHALALDDPRVSHTLGRLAFQAGNYPWASGLLEESARKLPKDLNLLYDLGCSRYSLGNVTEAVAAMQLPAQAGPQYSKAAEAKRFLSMVAAADNPDQARQLAGQAQEILAVDPNYVPALMLSARLKEQQGNYKEAAELYDRILSRYPSFTPATRNLAILCFEHLGDDSKAYTLAVQARGSSKDDFPLDRVLGILSYRRGDYSFSAQLLDQCARERQKDPELLFYVGMAHYRLKEHERSKQALRQALALEVQPKLADEARRTLQQLP